MCVCVHYRGSAKCDYIIHDRFDKYSQNRDRNLYAMLWATVYKLSTNIKQMYIGHVFVTLISINEKAARFRFSSRATPRYIQKSISFFLMRYNKFNEVLCKCHCFVIHNSLNRFTVDWCMPFVASLSQMWVKLAIIILCGQMKTVQTHQLSAEIRIMCSIL